MIGCSFHESGYYKFSKGGTNLSSSAVCLILAFYQTVLTWGAVTLKSLTTASIYALINKYFHGYDWKSSTLMRSVVGSLSSAVAELLMTSIIQRILTLLCKDGNEGIKRIFDQGLNAATSGGINIKAYDMLTSQRSA